MAEAHSEYDMLPCPADTHVATNVSTPELKSQLKREGTVIHTTNISLAYSQQPETL